MIKLIASCARACVVLLGVAAGAAVAQPWLDTGDTALRHDIQLLSDWGVVRRPTTAWPLSAPDIAIDVMDDDRIADLSPSQLIVVERVRTKLRGQMRTRKAEASAAIAAGADQLNLRSYEDTPRSEGVVRLQVVGVGQRWAYRLRLTHAVDAPDDRENRLDESYAALNAGNWIVGVGSQSRWWGPGWDGSLILSNNARPVPSIFFQRRKTDPFESRWLNWLGPWQFTGFLAQLESARAVENARLFGLRLNFRPSRYLEVGLSRTAQWAGEGRPNDLDSFLRLLAGRDNVGDQGTTESNEPGNQLAGYDFRYRLGRLNLPMAVYGQFIGEDEAGGLPAKFIGLLGVEGWHHVSGRFGGQLRWWLEAADTAVEFYQGEPRFNTAYENGAYPSGYRYYGQSIGHYADNDSRTIALGALLRRPSGTHYQAQVRRIELNRDNGAGQRANPLAPDGADAYRLDVLAGFEASSRDTLQVGVGGQHLEARGAEDDTTVHGYVRWTRELQ